MLRNYYHGQLLALRRPAGMATASILRVGTLATFSVLLLTADLLSAAGAALALLTGFAVEAVISGFALSRLRLEHSQAA